MVDDTCSRAVELKVGADDVAELGLDVHAWERERHHELVGDLVPAVRGQQGRLEDGAALVVAPDHLFDLFGFAFARVKGAVKAKNHIGEGARTGWAGAVSAAVAETVQARMVGEAETAGPGVVPIYVGMGRSEVEVEWVG